MKSISLYTDGASRNNPGEAGAGWVILDENQNILEESCKYLGVTTNNQAEYQALILGLESIKKYTNIHDVSCHLDSELIVKQLNREYKVKHKDMKPLFETVQKIIFELNTKVKFIHIRREKNKQADKLANLAIDTKV